MTGIVVLAVLVLTIVAALQLSDRRHAGGPHAPLNGSWDAADRDITRSRAEVLALAGRTEPSSRVSSATGDPGDIITARRTRQAKQTQHSGHGRQSGRRPARHLGHHAA